MGYFNVQLFVNKTVLLHSQLWIFVHEKCQTLAVSGLSVNSKTLITNELSGQKWFWRG